MSNVLEVYNALPEGGAEDVLVLAQQILVSGTITCLTLTSKHIDHSQLTLMMIPRDTCVSLV